MRISLMVACLASIVLLAPAPSILAASPPNLVLHYAFNADTTTVIHDSSASALNGTLVNSDPATAFVKGAPGKRKGLQLIASQQQYVDVPQGAALDLDRYTLAAWVRYTGVSTPDTHDRWEVLEKAGAYWLNIRTNGRVRAGGFYGGCDNSQFWKFFDSNHTVPINVWTHVAATYNGSKLTIYINGQSSGSLNVTGATCSNDEPLAVGAKNAPTKGILDAFWDGRLDDVRIYGRSLKPARIVQLAE